VALKTLDQLDVRGKRVLVRVDFNVPLADGVVTDDTRIRAALPTIHQLLDEDASVILISHLGRPRGVPDPRYSLAPVTERLSALLGRDVAFATDTVGDSAKAVAAALQPGQVALLENLRFQAGEERNDAGFARQLAALGDCYVNDAFGAAHRAHASTAAIASLLPSAAGLLMQAEIKALSGVLHNPARPFVVIIGGAKVSDKIAVIESLLARADELLIGGGMANTFLLAQGLAVGTSLAEHELAGLAAELLQRAADNDVRILLPEDVVVAAGLDRPDTARVTPVNAVGADDAIFDIGPRTVELFAERIARARTIVWNGPMGVFETPPFDAGTLGVARAVAGAAGYSLVGGGDSVAAVEQAGLADRIDHISTGGGASLEFLEGKQLPGIAALEHRT
jgi:phosphoglycerate kinase